MSNSEYELEGTRYRVKYRGESYYVSIFKNEVFMSSVEEKSTLTASGISTITRLLTMALKAYPQEEVLKQLDRSSLSHKDLPGILAKLIRGDYIIP